jgi:glycosyltransferase involved in cell wall biosynthesis
MYRSLAMPLPPKVSVVVPLFNEAENVLPLAEALRSALASLDSYEVLLVDDASTDETWRRIAEAAAFSGFRGVRLRRNAGQTAAMMAGFDHARAPVIVSLDGDLQNDPRDIPALLEKLDEGYDLVCGWRQSRQDGFFLRKVPSWCANRIIKRLSGVAIRDNGCSLKAYRREIVQHLNLYSDQHRFIPALSASWGARIAEIPVRHHARRFGQSKYGLSRTVKVMADLVALKMLTTFRHQPLLGFAAFASFTALPTAVVFAAWLLMVSRSAPGHADGLVLPGVALLLLACTVYLLMLGLAAEVALRRQRAEDPLGSALLPVARIA